MKYAKQFGHRANRPHRAAKTKLVNRRDIIKAAIDGPPREVATEMLATLGLRMSGAERRVFQRARVNYFTSRVGKIPTQIKQPERFRKATFVQLRNWLRRCIERRAESQRAYLRLERDTTMSAEVRNSLAQTLDFQAQALDLARDHIEHELADRAARCAVAKPNKHYKP